MSSNGWSQLSRRAQNALFHSQSLRRDAGHPPSSPPRKWPWTVKSRGFWQELNYRSTSSRRLCFSSVFDWWKWKGREADRGPCRWATEGCGWRSRCSKPWKTPTMVRSPHIRRVERKKHRSVSNYFHLAIICTLHAIIEHWSPASGVLFVLIDQSAVHMSTCFQLLPRHAAASCVNESHDWVAWSAAFFPPEDIARRNEIKHALILFLLQLSWVDWWVLLE